MTEQIHHNHLSDDVKPPFLCPACDKYRWDEQEKLYPEPPPGYTHESWAKFVKSYR